jgi:hypothetical protein
MEIMEQTMDKPLELYEKLRNWNAQRKFPYPSLPPLEWLRAAGVKRSDGKGGKLPSAPVLGDIDIVLTPLTIGMDDEETYVTDRLQRDLPGRSINDTGRDAMLTQAMRDIQKTTVEAAVAAQARDADKDTKKAKTQATHSPFVKAKLSKLLKQDDETQFPETYQGDHCQEE